MSATSLPSVQEALEGLYTRLLANSSKILINDEGKIQTLDIRPGHFQKVRDHIEGQARIGIVPVVGDPPVNTHFLALDLDFKPSSPVLEAFGVSLFRIVKALYRIGLVPVVEQSKGKGFHIWIFHTLKIPLGEAVKLIQDIKQAILALGIIEVPEGVQLNIECFPKKGPVGVWMPGYGLAQGFPRCRTYLWSGKEFKENWDWVYRFGELTARNNEVIQLLLPISRKAPPCVLAAFMQWEEGQRNRLLNGVAGVFRNMNIPPDVGWELISPVLTLLGDEEITMREANWFHTYERERYASCSILMAKNAEFPIERNCCTGTKGCPGFKVDIQESRGKIHAYMPEEQEQEGEDNKDPWATPVEWRQNKNGEWEAHPATHHWPYAEQLLKHFKFWSEGMKSPLWRYDEEEGIWRDDAEDWLAYMLTITGMIPPKKRNRAFIQNVIDLVKAASFKGEFPQPRKEYIPVRNGVVHIDTLQLLPYSPEFYFRHKLPFTWLGKRSVKDFPTVWGFMQDVVDKKDLFKLLRLLAQSIYTGTEFETAYILIGAGANGKTVFVEHILKPLVGVENISSVSLHELADHQLARFRVAELCGKLVNFSGELSYQGIKHTDLFKKLVSGDTISAERKFRDPFKFRNYATLVFATNHLPQFEDKTLAIWRRLIVVEFPYLFTSKDKEAVPSTEKWRIKPRDEYLPERLKTAMEAGEKDALGSFLIRLLRLMRRYPHKFRESAAARRERYKRLSINIYQFLDEMCERDPTGEVTARDLHLVYATWCEIMGKHTLPAEKYASILEEEGFIRDRRNIFGRKHTVYQGLRLNRWKIWKFFSTDSLRMRKVANILVLPDDLTRHEKLKQAGVEWQRTPKWVLQYGLKELLKEELHPITDAIHPAAGLRLLLELLGDDINALKKALSETENLLIERMRKGEEIIC